MIFEETYSNNLELSRDKILEFFEKEGYVFEETRSNIVQGKRGSLFWNYITFDMRKLETVITVELDQDSVHVTISVNTVGQVITATEAELWPLELNMFGMYLEGNENYLELKNEYNGKKKLFLIKLILGIVILGAVISVIIISAFS